MTKYGETPDVGGYRKSFSSHMKTVWVGIDSYISSMTSMRMKGAAGVREHKMGSMLMLMSVFNFMRNAHA